MFYLNPISMLKRYVIEFPSLKKRDGCWGEGEKKRERERERERERRTRAKVENDDDDDDDYDYDDTKGRESSEMVKQRIIRFGRK